MIEGFNRHAGLLCLAVAPRIHSRRTAHAIGDSQRLANRLVHWQQGSMMSNGQDDEAPFGVLVGW
ncbi:MAG: hypothetical protein ACTHK5_05700, partial [Tsuneonella sp.]